VVRMAVAGLGLVQVCLLAWVLALALPALPHKESPQVTGTTGGQITVKDGGRVAMMTEKGKDYPHGGRIQVGMYPARCTQQELTRSLDVARIWERMLGMHGAGTRKETQLCTR